MPTFITSTLTRINRAWENRSSADRDAHVYEVANQPGVWRIRLQLYPEHSTGGVWWGGRVLWGFDQDSKEGADYIANRWIKYAEFPERNDMSAGPRGRTAQARRDFLERQANKREASRA